MDETRRASFQSLIRHIKIAKLVICADANINDSVLSFIKKLRSIEDTIYYRNQYKNKDGVKLNVYYRQKNSVRKELEKYCELMKESITDGESMIIASDSKTIALNVYNYLLSFNPDKDYFKVYVSDVGKEDDFGKCNTEWVNKCVIISPRVLYGLDVTIKYDKIYAIYKCQTIDSTEMLQQVSRARNCKEVNILFTVKDYQKYSNRYISYEENEELELADLNEYQDNLKKKYDLTIKDLGCQSVTDKIVFNHSSLFTDIHLHLCWYKKLFNYNKAQLFLKLCEEQGYLVNEKHFEEDKSAVKFKYVTEKFDAETYQQFMTIVFNVTNDTDYLIKLEDRHNHLFRKLDMRLNQLGWQIEEIEEEPDKLRVISDDKVFQKYVKTQLLLKDPKSSREDIESFMKSYPEVEKDKLIYKQLDLISWLEQELRIKRFEVDKINLSETEIKRLHENLTKNITKMYCLQKCNGKKQINNNTIKLIAKLLTNDKIQKLLADCYNLFGDHIDYKTKRIIKDNIKITTYIKFLRIEKNY